MGDQGMPGVTQRGSHELVFCAPYSRRQLSLPASFRILGSVGSERARQARSLFVLCSSSQLESVASLVSHVNKRHGLKMLLVYSDTDPTWLPQMLERADLRAIRNMIVHSDVELPRRILRAWELGAQDSLIAKAIVVEDRLLVVTCSAKRYEVKFTDAAPLRRIPVSERGHFSLAEDGSYLHWPVPDIHLDADAIRTFVEPEWRDRSLAKKLSHDRGYGAAIKSLRESLGHNQTGIGDLSERQVRRIETGESLTVESLRRYSAGLGLEFDDFLGRVAELAQSTNTRAS